MPGPSPKVPPEDYKQLHRFEISNQARAINFSCFQNQPFLSSEQACKWLAEAVAEVPAWFDTH